MEFFGYVASIVFMFWVFGLEAWDLNYQTKDRTRHPALEGEFNHWTAREVPIICSFKAN